MLVFSKKKTDNSTLVELLERILKIEYSFIVTYPRLARLIKDNNTRILVNSLGTTSVKHADIVAAASTKYGGNPVWSFEQIPDSLDLLEQFTQQLEKEKLALQLHEQCTELVKDENLKFEFSCMAEEERAHIKTAERIISNLKQGAKDREITRSFVSRFSAAQ